METKEAPPTNEPLTVNVGSVEIPIYSRKRIVAGREYEEHTLSYYDPCGKRVRRSFGDLAEAKKEARRIATALSKGQHAAASLSPADVAHVQWSLATLKPTGVSLPAALTEWLEARAKLPKGVALNHVIEDFLRRNPAGLTTRTVAEIVAEHYADLERRGSAPVYLESARKLGGQFSNAFRCPLSAVTRDVFHAWLWKLKKRDGKPPSGRTLLNTVRAFRMLMTFASRRRYVSREAAAEIIEMETPKAPAPTCEGFSADSFRKLLHAADQGTLASLVLGGLCGIRMSELKRLTWEDVSLSEGVVKLSARATKTQSRRVIELPPNALEWLGRVEVKEGAVMPVDVKAVRLVAARAGVRWVPNGLRHSWVSAKLASSKNASLTAYEAGNSVRMCQLHYRSLMTEPEANAWFDVRPARTENVIEFKPQHAGVA